MIVGCRCEPRSAARGPPSSPGEAPSPAESLLLLFLPAFVFPPGLPSADAASAAPVAAPPLVSPAVPVVPGAVCVPVPGVASASAMDRSDPSRLSFDTNWSTMSRPARKAFRTCPGSVVSRARRFRSARFCSLRPNLNFTTGGSGVDFPFFCAAALPRRLCGGVFSSLELPAFDCDSLFFDPLPAVRWLPVCEPVSDAPLPLDPKIPPAAAAATTRSRSVGDSGVSMASSSSSGFRKTSLPGAPRASVSASSCAVADISLSRSR